jgi:hypothetical protein
MNCIEFEVRTYNSTGKHYTELQELLSFLEDVLLNPRFITGLVNSNRYQPTKEVAGVFPVPEDIRVKYGMVRFEPSLDATWPHHHRKAILPVLNQEKMDLFRTMMSGSNSFGNFSSEEVTAGVRIWNGKADADINIFYKVISSHY